MMERNIELERACTLLPDSLAPLGCEAISASLALGRVLADSLRAEHDFPPRDAAAYTGYAVRSDDLNGAKSSRPVVLKLCAEDTVGAGEARAVAGGEVLPMGCDAVLPLVGARAEEGRLAALRALWPHEGVVRRGEDCRTGEVLLPAGKCVDAATAALLAQAELSEISVLRLPQVALLSQGAAPGWESLLRTKLGENHVALCASVEEADFLLAPFGASFPDALPVFDGIKADPLEQVGLFLWQGKPLFMLPIAVADVLAAFSLLVCPALVFLTGNSTLQLRRTIGALESAFPRSSPVRRFLHASFRDGSVTLPGGLQPLSPIRLARCNCLIEIPAGSAPLEAGAQVVVWI